MLRFLAQSQLRWDHLKVIRRCRASDGIGTHRSLWRRVAHPPGAVNAGVRSPAPFAAVRWGHVRERRVEENPDGSNITGVISAHG